MENHSQQLSEDFIREFQDKVDRDDVSYNQKLSEMKKVIRDGKVAVLYSPGFGAGWYSWNREYPLLMFHPELVEVVENKKHPDEIESIAEKLIKEHLNVTDPDDFYFYRGGGVVGLEIAWLDEGTTFDIAEYDGSESIRIITPDLFFTA